MIAARNTRKTRKGDSVLKGKSFGSSGPRRGELFSCVSCISWFAVAALLLLAGSLCSRAQIVEVYDFANLNRSISDGKAAGICDVHSVTSAVVNVTSVRVRLRIAGEFNGDLYAYVRQVNAAGTNWCVLLNRPGCTATDLHGYDDEGLDVMFDDAAPNGDIHNYRSMTNVPAGSPLTGLWKPDGRTTDPGGVLDTQIPSTWLSSFKGTAASGEWTLFLADSDNGGTNLLLGWQLELAGQPAAPPPVLEVIPDQIAYVLKTLVLTNRVIDSNLVTQPLMFGLEAGAPTGARVNHTTGVFRWTPTRAQARSTNMITVWMTDSGSPAVNATNTFIVVVDDYVELTLGRAVVRAGQSSNVAVTLVTTTGLTNLEALVQMPDESLVPLALTGSTPAVGNLTLAPQGPSVWQMAFTAAPEQLLQGTQELARLSFLAFTNGSTFIPLELTITTNSQANGLSVWRTLTTDGRVVVIDQDPLLEALPLTNGLPNLIVYGISGVSYEVQLAPVVPGTGLWQPVWTGTVPASLWTPVSGLSNTGPEMFFRARESP